MLDTMLVFFFSITLFFFFTWITKNEDKALILSFVALGVGLLAKYEVLVAGVVMVAAILLLERHKLRWRFSKLLLVPIVAILVVAPWFVVLYQTNGASGIGQVLSVMGGGQPERTPYSTRFPAPVFYLIEMTWPFPDIPVHPVSLLIFILGFFGLGLWAYRRKTEDKFFLIWFIVVYVFFTLIPNRQWRYVITIFPVLAISAASFIIFVYGKAAEAWRQKQISLNKKNALKIAAGLLVVLAAIAIVYSSSDAYQMVVRDQIHIPIEEATSYAANRLSPNESIMVLCAFNLFNRDMVEFYLQATEPRQNQVWQYPELAVDAFTPNFNVTELISLCEEHNVKYALLYAYGGSVPYFNTTLTAMDVYQSLLNSGRFTYEYRVPAGMNSRSITVFSFA